jgi:hypothetical protein
MAEEGEQVSADNVVVQVVDVVVGPRGGITPHIELVGSGKAYVFRDGRMILGRWERESLRDITRFVAKDGSEIAIAWPNVGGAVPEPRRRRDGAERPEGSSSGDQRPVGRLRSAAEAGRGGPVSRPEALLHLGAAFEGGHRAVQVVLRTGPRPIVLVDLAVDPGEVLGEVLERTERRPEPTVHALDHGPEVAHDLLERADDEALAVREQWLVEPHVATERDRRRERGRVDHVGEHRVLRRADEDERWHGRRTASRTWAGVCV